MWSPALLSYINTIYASVDSTILNGWNDALYNTMQRCNGDQGCAAEVWLYFGQTNIALPNLGPAGDVNWLVNVVTATFSTPSFDNSPANTLFTRYANGAICKNINESNKNDTC